ncbi:AAA family ATPase [Streptomyces sp. NPDC059568]|uniref:AAA family ATPase n=1 Tax=Streptomyces sp. NPDC059568 TaxID=3346868 RepID=UPI0036C5AEAC
MAELVRVEAENFRAFRKCALDIGSSGLVLVAGPNNSGKSALLSMLDVLAGTTPERVEHFFGGRTSVTATWRLTQKERAELLSAAPDVEHLIASGVAEYLMWEFGELLGSIQPVAVGFNYGDGWRHLARLEAQNVWSWRLTATSLEALLAGNDEPALATRSSGSGEIGDALNLFSGIPVAQDVLRRWRQGYFHFQPLRQANGRSASLSNVSGTLEPNGSNLATVLLHLQTNEPRVWSNLLQLIVDIIPNVGNLMTPVSGATCEITFSDSIVRGGFQHNLKDLGTGVEQLLMLLVVGLTRTARTVILEDPEIGLHPSAQRALLGLLQDWSRYGPILAATHSAAMLDWTSPSSTVIAVSRKNGVSEATVVTTERASVLRELGMRMSDVLSAERILVLEGPTDRDILDIWFRDVLRSPRVVVLQGGGGYDARHADLLATWLTAADQLGQRRVLYVRDRDELSGAFLKKLESSPNTFLLPGREIENLLLNYEAIAKVISKERASQQRNDPVTPTEIATAARSAADELKQMVVMKRVMTELAEPIRLVDNNMRRKLARASPSEETLIAAVTDRVPQRDGIQAHISKAWTAHSQAVNATWDQDWETLAPGADVLKSIWQNFLARGYSKSTDGPSLAEEIKTPPKTLRDIFDTFMSDSERG